MTRRGKWRPARRPRAEAVQGWVAVEVRGWYTALIAPDSARELAAELLGAADAIDPAGCTDRIDRKAAEFGQPEPNDSANSVDRSKKGGQSRQKGIRASGKR